MTGAQDQTTRFDLSMFAETAAPGRRSARAVGMPSTVAILAGTFAAMTGGTALLLLDSESRQISAAGYSTSTPGWILAWVIAILLVAVPVALLVVYTVRAIRRVIRAPGRAVLDQFAMANGWMHFPAASVGVYHGAAFSVGMSPELGDRIGRQIDGRNVELGTLTYEVRIGNSSTMYTWTYAAITLDRSLPSLMLEATRYRGTLGALPATLPGGVRLSLEGDFDSRFTLTCAPGTEQVALYLLPPDTMALLMDDVCDFDVEVAGDTLYLLTPLELRAFDGPEYRRLFRAIGVLLSTITAQAALSAAVERIRPVAPPMMSAAVPGGPAHRAAGSRATGRARVGIVVSSIVYTIVLAVGVGIAIFALGGAYHLH